MCRLGGWSFQKFPERKYKVKSFFSGNKSKVVGSSREYTKVQIKYVTVIFQAMNISQQI